MEFFMVEHGGDLARAVQTYGIERSKWIDLSTGINPNGYEIKHLSHACFHRLPEREDLFDLEQVARRAYGVKETTGLISAPGTEFLIHALPQLRFQAKVAVLSPTFSSHETAWMRFGHDVRRISDLKALQDEQVVIVVNPNNPDGRVIAPKKLRKLAQKLTERGGFLVIDEAFVDVAPEHSFVPMHDKNNVIVLRSVGKFYGVAGVRLGFAIGANRYLDALRQILGAWAVSGPAIELGAQVLSDETWAEQTRAVLKRQSAQHQELLLSKGLKVVGGSVLFHLIEVNDARKLHVQLAKRAIWTRVFDYDVRWLRLGLCKSQNELSRFALELDDALVSMKIAA